MSEASLRSSLKAELAELASIYERRGLSPALARQVAVELSQHDRLPIHAREKLGFDIATLAKPVQASAVSALSFTVGALLPVLIVAIAPASSRLPLTVAATLIGLVILGLVGARLGGAPPLRAAIRVLIGGTLALSIALGIGRLTGSVV